VTESPQDASPTPADPNAPALPPQLFTRILVRLGVFLVVVAAGSLGIGFAVDGMRGVWGALIGTGLAALFAVTTVVAVRTAAKRPMDLMVIAVMGSWLLKMVLVLLVIVAIKDADFYHRGVMFGATAVAVVGSVLIDLQTVATARIPHVRP
jgi:branched-subunit amino acid transport protein AzlD